MKKLILSTASIVFLFANGYKIPEQSLNALALSSAYVANASGADSAYYNPANMAFNPNKNYFEFLTTFIHLNKVEFDNTNTEVYYSRTEDYILPQFHYASKDINGWRFGISITYPAGLSKKWDDVIPEAGAKEFTLKTIELNPVIAKRLNENWAIGFGIRIVKSRGIANVLGMQDNGNNTYTPLYSEYLNGTSIDYGWNAAISYQNKEKQLKIALTYRSKVNLTLDGDASGYYLSDLLLAKNPTLPLQPHTYYTFNTGGRVTLPLPATLNFAIAKTFNKTTLEFDLDRTFWSTYKSLDFDFDNPYVDALFGSPKPKNWKNTYTYRFGLTHRYSNKLTLMLGYAYDKTPVPDSTIDFSLPDTDKHIFSGGFKYKLTKNLTIGFSALFTKNKKRSASIYDKVTQSYTTGEFKEGGAYLMAFGLDYQY